jgi:RimJ/RimL family protein N-acetyltransferase
MDLRFEPLTPEDFPTLVRWTASQEFLLQWAGPGFSYPLTVEQLEAHYRGCLVDPPAREMWKVLDGASGPMIAHAELSGIDRVLGAATVSRVIVGDPHMRGKGVGTALMRELIRRAFHTLDLATLDLNVFDFNKRALDCYRRVGFRIDTRLENVRRVGDSYWSLYHMTLSRTPPGPERSA